MSNTKIQIKRSLTSSQPSSLNVGELGYSYLSNTAFIGTPDGTGVIAIGGKSYLDLINTSFGVANAAYNAANSAGSLAIISTIFGVANAGFNEANAAYTLASAAFDKANSDISTIEAYANQVGVNANTYASSVGVAANTYASAVGVAANTFATSIGASSNAHADQVGTNANTFATSIGASSNAHADQVGTNANTYASSVGVNANTYASAVGVAANTYADGVGTSANAYARTFANTVGTAANTYAAAVGTNANTFASAVGVSANNYAGVMANSANAYASATYYAKTGGAISGDVSITGNLTITGTTLYANTAHLWVGDNTVVLNAELPSGSAPLALSSGLAVNRGTSPNTALVWSESLGAWAYTNDGTNYLKIASNTDIAAGNTYASAVGVAANVYAAAVGTSANTYADGVGTAANTNAANGSYISTGTVAVPYGGTGVGSFTLNGILYGNTSGPLKVTAAGTEGQVLQANALGVPTFAMLDGGTF